MPRPPRASPRTRPATVCSGGSGLANQEASAALSSRSPPPESKLSSQVFVSPDSSVAVRLVCQRLDRFDEIEPAISSSTPLASTLSSDCPVRINSAKSSSSVKPSAEETMPAAILASRSRWAESRSGVPAPLQASSLNTSPLRRSSASRSPVTNNCPPPTFETRTNSSPASTSAETIGVGNNARRSAIAR